MHRELLANHEIRELEQEQFKTKWFVKFEKYTISSVPLEGETASVMCSVTAAVVGAGRLSITGATKNACVQGGAEQR